MNRSKELTAKQCVYVIERMGEYFPEAACELVHRNPFELVAATLLSAQATDVSVNKVTPRLFELFPTPETMAEAPIDALEEVINSIGLYRNKAKYLKAMANQLVQEYGGQVPQTREELMKLAGVGRKTANVVLSVAFDIPAIAIDTHVERVTKRLRMVPADASVMGVEKTLMAKLPPELWNIAHHRLIFFGRYAAPARAKECPLCDQILDEVQNIK